MAMAALEDEETQKHGFIMVGCNMGPKRVVDRNAASVVTKIRQIIPMRVVAVHYLYDDFRMRPMLFVVMSLSKAYGRVRVRAHYGESMGFRMLLEFSFVIPATIVLTLPNLCLLVFFQGSPEENRFKLLSYGLPIDTLPFNDCAECKVKQHLQWLQTRRNQEQTPLLPGAARVVIPGRFDVLFGRGKPMQERPGNLVR
jgi:hypothetical protein